MWMPDLQLSENMLDYFVSDVAGCVRRRRFRRWVICSPWLSLPVIWRAAWRRAAFNYRINKLKPWARIDAMMEEWHRAAEHLTRRVHRGGVDDTEGMKCRPPLPPST